MNVFLLVSAMSIKLALDDVKVEIAIWVPNCGQLHFYSHNYAFCSAAYSVYEH